jgi:hypothetical protein
MLFEYTDILELTAENQLSAAARQEIDALDQKLFMALVKSIGRR